MLHAIIGPSEARGEEHRQPCHVHHPRKGEARRPCCVMGEYPNSSADALHRLVSSIAVAGIAILSFPCPGGLPHMTFLRFYYCYRWLINTRRMQCSAALGAWKQLESAWGMRVWPRGHRSVLYQSRTERHPSGAATFASPAGASVDGGARRDRDTHTTLRPAWPSHIHKTSHFGALPAVLSRYGTDTVRPSSSGRVFLCRRSPARFLSFLAKNVLQAGLL